MFEDSSGKYKLLIMIFFTYKKSTNEFVMKELFHWLTLFYIILCHSYTQELCSFSWKLLHVRGLLLHYSTLHREVYVVYANLEHIICSFTFMSLSCTFYIYVCRSSYPTCKIPTLIDFRLCYNHIDLKIQGFM